MGKRRRKRRKRRRRRNKLGSSKSKSPICSTFLTGLAATQASCRVNNSAKPNRKSAILKNTWLCILFFGFLQRDKFIIRCNNFNFWGQLFFLELSCGSKDLYI